MQQTFKEKAIFNWSGGKDSSMALYKIIQENFFDIRYLVTTVNQHYNRVSMHGVRKELLEKQAELIGIPLHQVLLSETPSMGEYNQAMNSMMLDCSEQGIGYSIFGDIFLEDLRLYREEQLSKIGMKGVFPLWKLPTDRLLVEFIEAGFKAIIVCVNEKYLNRSFAGRLIDYSFLQDLPAGVDPCGENGEYHSFVFDGPIFREPVAVKTGEIVHKKYLPDNTNQAVPYDTGFYYCDLLMGA